MTEEETVRYFLKSQLTYDQYLVIIYPCFVPEKWQ